MSNSHPKHDSIDYPDDPTQPHDVVEWHPRVDTIDTIDAHPNNYVKTDSIATTRPAPGVVGWVISTSEKLSNYVDEHGRGTIDVPEYYSRFPEFGSHDTPSADDYLGTGPGLETDDGDSAIHPHIARLAIRILNGKGRYPASEHTLYDCLPYPCPLVRDDVGAVLIAPRVAPSGLDGD